MISMDGRSGPALILGLALVFVPSAARAQVDAVFANEAERNRVCLNDSTGAFACSDVSDDTNLSRGVALADVDGVDGIDAVFANDGGRNRVCLNDGTGAFTCSDLSTDTNSTYDVALADLDGVGGIDAVFANNGGENRVCLNDGTGTFTCSDVSPGSTLSTGVALADLDGVNGIDAVFANIALSGDRNQVCLNDGTGAFTCSDISDDTNTTSGVALADLDGVNGIDAVFANDGDGNRVCLNDGTGAFTCSNISGDTNVSFGVALADLDGVNGVDAVFANLQRNRVCINDGTGVFTCSDVSDDTNVSLGVALAEVDGVDGIDAVFANRGGPNRVCLNDGTGTFTCSDLSTDMNDTAAVALGFLREFDLAITMTDEQTTAVPGETLTYVIAVGNSGPTSASAAVSDAFPPDLSCIWSCAGDGGATCTEGPVSGDIVDAVVIPAGGVATYFAVCTVDPAAVGTLTNTATALPSGGLDLDTTNNTATDIDGLTPRADLVITTTDGQATAVPGSSVTYVIGANNVGPSDVHGAQVGDLFSSALSCTWTCAASGGATCTPGPVAGDIDDTVDLPVGGAVGFLAVCAIDSAATGVLVNKAAVLPPAGAADPVSANNSAADFDLLTPVADVTVTKDDGQATAVPGEMTVYTILASNPAGPSDAPGTAVSDVFSSLLDCTWTCAASGGAACTAGPVAGDLDDLADLPVGGAVEYTATCTLDSGAVGRMTNTATVAVAAGVSDPSAGNDSATDVDTLTPEADLAITKDDGVTSVEPGDPVVYTIVAANPGPSDALAAVVEDLFPPELIDCEWTCAPAGGALCTGGPVAGDLVDSVDLPAGGSATYTASCSFVPGAEPSVLENTATITAPAGMNDPEPGNNSATDTDSGPLIFADGFESGDTSAWSVTVP